jgi:hypothetical protein
MDPRMSENPVGRDGNVKCRDDTLGFEPESSRPRTRARHKESKITHRMSLDLGNEVLERPMASVA